MVAQTLKKDLKVHQMVSLAVTGHQSVVQIDEQVMKVWDALGPDGSHAPGRSLKKWMSPPTKQKNPEFVESGSNPG